MKSVAYDTCNKLNCVCNGEVIICVDEALSESGLSYIIGTVAFIDHVTNASGCCVWQYAFTYDEALLADPDYSLVPADITGVICKGCWTEYVESLLTSNINFTPGSVLFASAAGTINEDNAHLYWDNVNNFLGVGTNTPSYTLDVTGNINFTDVIYSNASPFIHTYHDVTADGFNIFVGLNAGNFTMSPAGGAATLSSYNTIVGNSSLLYNTTGSYNSALGYRALISNTTGEANSAFGVFALENSSTAINNSAFGRAALRANVTGRDNCAFGFNALISTTASYNSAFGSNTLVNNIGGAYNSAFGFETLYYNTTGAYNCAFGHRALLSNTIAGANCAFGAFALELNTADNNSAFGYTALRVNTTGINNNAFGYAALVANTTGSYNSAFGVRVLTTNTTADDNSAFGYEALKVSNGAGNSAFGSLASYSNTSGVYNCAFGHRALLSNTIAGANCAFGAFALTASTANSNTAFGYKALIGNTTGAGNVALGNEAGYYETGSNKLFIDNAARASEADGRVKSLVYGIFDAATANQRLRINGRLGVTEVPVYANNAAALGGGLVAGEFYRTNSDPDPICIVH